MWSQLLPCCTGSVTHILYYSFHSSAHNFLHNNLVLTITIESLAQYLYESTWGAWRDASTAQIDFMMKTYTCALPVGIFNHGT